MWEFVFGRAVSTFIGIFGVFIFLQDTDVDLPVGQTELYHMEIHRNKEWTIPVVTGAMNEASKAEVVFDETLHVRTWIDGGKNNWNIFFFFFKYFPIEISLTSFKTNRFIACASRQCLTSRS
jgi:hypothetical protein